MKKKKHVISCQTTLYKYLLKEDNSGHRKEFPVTEENCSWKKEISLRSNIPVTERSLLFRDRSDIMSSLEG